MPSCTPLTAASATLPVASRIESISAALTRFPDSMRSSPADLKPDLACQRLGLDNGPIDEALRPFGLERKIVTIVGGFSTALGLARGSDLIASVPGRHTGNLRAGMYSFPLPVPTPEITISMLWHPRMDADNAHRWLRGCLRDVCTKHLGNSPAPVKAAVS